MQLSMHYHHKTSVTEIFVLRTIHCESFCFCIAYENTGIKILIQLGMRKNMEEAVYTMKTKAYTYVYLSTYMPQETNKKHYLLRVLKMSLWKVVSQMHEVFLAGICFLSVNLLPQNPEEEHTASCREK